MSIVRCEECEKTMDTDVEEANDIRMTERYIRQRHYWIWLCRDCYEENNKEEL